MKNASVCVVFDLDDTLYLERDYVASGFNAVSEWCRSNLNLVGVSELAQQLFAEGRRGDIFNEVLRRLCGRAEAETTATLVKVYREHKPNLKLPLDSAVCLSRLSGHVPIGLITDGNTVPQWGKIDALSLRNRFDTIIVTGDWGADYYKPHPRSFRYIEMQHARSSAHFIYIADNPAKDFITPRTLGWSTIRVLRPGGLHVNCPCAESLVDFEVPDLGSVPEIVLRTPQQCR